MDRYDAEIARLTAAPQDIKRSWTWATPLFSGIGRDGSTYRNGGCLTQIKADPTFYNAFVKGVRDEALEAEIMADERIPDNVDSITMEMLSVFAEWQRKIDALQKA